jgi:Do/DeqQ family serine protease
VPAPAPTEQAAAAPSAGPDFTRVAAQTVRAVTNIASTQVIRRSASPFANDPFFQYFFGDQDDLFGRSRAQQSLGSGVVISPDGFVVTNNHVIGEGGNEVTVTVGDRREVRAKVIGFDSWTDLALLKVDAANLPVIPWGDSAKLRVAEWVMAVGNPFSLNQTVTLGIVSALGRANVGITQYEDFIQTDAAINPGNSGGALINSRGELVGINTAIFSQSGGYQGIGFAVPSNLVRRVVDDLKKFGQVRRGSIGLVEVIPLTGRLADELRAPQTQSDGVVVNQLHRDSAAYQAGLEPGDIILSFNGTAISDPSQFVRLVADSPIGSTARVEVLREGRRQTIRIPIQAQERRRRR